MALMTREELIALARRVNKVELLPEWEEKPIPGAPIELVSTLRSTREAHFGTPDDGIHVSLSYQPTCYRRGPWRLLITVNQGLGHLKWGCFDDQDQPNRYYHLESSALMEADQLIRVLILGRLDEEQRSAARTEETTVDGGGADGVGGSAAVDDVQETTSS